ncbi:MAG: copper amine oxidase N-terminal domain-containing protein [Ezakiella massiliensis]
MMDAAAYMKGEELMLPIRYIAKVIGYDVQWNAKTRTIILSDNDNIIEFYVDSKILRVNKQKIDIEPNFEVRDGRTYVSISNIRDLLELSKNKEILWDEEAKTISLILKK